MYYAFVEFAEFSEFINSVNYNGVTRLAPENRA